MSTIETPISIIRSLDKLFTLSIREKASFHFETDTPAELTMLTDRDSSYKFVRTSLTWQTERLTETQKHLLTAWDTLRSVQNLDGVVAASVLTVLQHTVPELLSDAVLPLLPWERLSKPARIVPTAAHPRAYQGTICKPPKEKTPAVVDLRPYLCDADGQARLLASLSRAGTGEGLRQAGADRDAALPQPFRLFIRPSLRQDAAAEVEHFLALYWELSLDRQPQLLAAVTLLVRHQPTANARHWCRIIVQQAAEWRLTFASLLLASEAYRVEASTLAPSVLPLFWEVQDGPCPIYRLFWLFRGLVSGMDSDYMAAGFRLADEVRSGYPFLRVEKSGYFPEQAIAGLIAHLKAGNDYYPWMPLTIWERCGERPGMGQILEGIAWTRYAPDVAFQYYEMYVRCINEDLSPDKSTAKWDWLRGQAGRIEELLQSIPANFQAKWLSHLRQLLWFWDTPQELTRNIPFAFMLLQRTCRPPYKFMCETTYVTSDFIAFLPDQAVERFLGAPDTGFLRLEEACRLENNARLIGYGTWSLTQHLPGFSVECFLHYPTKLFKVAKRLGGLPEEMRKQIVRDFGQSPLMENGLLTQDAMDADEIIRRHRHDGIFNPVPKKLQEHLAGSRVLSRSQFAMYREQMNRQLSLTRLEMLERAALTALRGRFAADPAQSSVSHALTMVHSADENRRALEKFLAAHWGGDDDYRLRHPLTQAWLDKHPKIDAAKWQRGIVFQAESASHGTLTLTAEQEPLEALKLGTYVGSCLGLGGDFAYSAVAAVLDINKQVVYARDVKGNVVARQLLALSDQDQLICFWVYPGSVSPPIQRMFIEYDRRFAEGLNIPLFVDDGDKSYTVETILSHGWWDDMVRDLEINGDTDNKSVTAQNGRGV